MGTDNAGYFRAKAAQCRHFADIATNNELRRLLDELAEEFERKAEEVERQSDQPAD